MDTILKSHHQIKLLHGCSMCIQLIYLPLTFRRHTVHPYDPMFEFPILQISKKNKNKTDYLNSNFLIFSTMKYLQKLYIPYPFVPYSFVPYPFSPYLFVPYPFILNPFVPYAFFNNLSPTTQVRNICMSFYRTFPQNL